MCDAESWTWVMVWIRLETQKPFRVVVMRKIARTTSNTYCFRIVPHQTSFVHATSEKLGRCISPNLPDLTL